MSKSHLIVRRQKVSVCGKGLKYTLKPIHFVLFFLILYIISILIMFICEKNTLFTDLLIKSNKTADKINMPSETTDLHRSWKTLYPVNILNLALHVCIIGVVTRDSYIGLFTSTLSSLQSLLNSHAAFEYIVIRFFFFHRGFNYMFPVDVSMVIII